MEIAVAGEIQSEWRGEATRTGKTPRKWMLVGDAEDGLGFRVVRSEYQPGQDAFETPRHHHAFQQIRWSEKGALNFAPDQDVNEGDIAYFPRGTFYGPQRRDNGIGLTLQFGFGLEMLGGKDASQVYREGIERLKARGRIVDGEYIDTDPETGLERRRDPAEAVTEEVTGKKFRIPDEGYATPILMHPDAYEYYQAAPGVELKHLGAFYDHPGPNADIRLSMIRLTGEAIYTLGDDRAQVAWATTGLRINGTSYEDLTCVYSPRGEVSALACAEAAEIYLIEFPRLD